MVYTVYITENERQVFMGNKRLEKIAKELRENDLIVMNNFKNNGIICRGFYIYDKGDYYRVFKNSDYFDLNKASSVIDFIANNQAFGESEV